MGVIKFRFAPGGAVRVEPSGFPGESCREATKPYLERLGGVILSDEPTDEARELAPAAAGAEQARA